VLQCVSEQSNVTHLWHGPPYWRLVYNVQIYLLRMQCCSVFQSKVMWPICDMGHLIGSWFIMFRSICWGCSDVVFQSKVMSPIFGMGHLIDSCFCNIVFRLCSVARTGGAVHRCSTHHANLLYRPENAGCWFWKTLEQFGRCSGSSQTNRAQLGT